MSVSANGLPVLEADITLVRVGVWHAELDVDSSDASKLTGSVTIDVEGQLFVGTATAVDAFTGRVKARVVGGAAGFGKAIGPQFYRGIPAHVPVAAILAAGGEKLSSSTPITGDLEFWTQHGATVGEAFAELVDSLGLVWRVLADGSVYAAKETWPAAVVEDLLVMSEDPKDGRVEFASKAPTLMPGTTFRGRKVSRVNVRVSSGAVRTVAWYEKGDGADDGDVVLAAIAKVVRQFTRSLDFALFYPARVVSQNANGSLELILDSPRMPGMSRIPMEHPWPGVSAEVAAGSRVLVYFHDADPAKPRAALWSSGTLNKLTLTCPDVRIGNASAAALAKAAETQAALNAIAALFTALSAPSVATWTAAQALLGPAGTSLATLIALLPTTRAKGT